MYLTVLVADLLRRHEQINKLKKEGFMVLNGDLEHFVHFICDFNNYMPTTLAKQIFIQDKTTRNFILSFTRIYQTKISNLVGNFYQRKTFYANQTISVNIFIISIVIPRHFCGTLIAVVTILIVMEV